MALRVRWSLGLSASEGRPRSDERRSPGTELLKDLVDAPPDEDDRTRTAARWPLLKQSGKSAETVTAHVPPAYTPDKHLSPEHAD